MFNVPEITPLPGCMNCCIPVEAVQHFGKHGQTPLASMVLHASRATTLIVQGALLKLPLLPPSVACWQIQLRIPELMLYQKRDLLTRWNAGCNCVHYVSF